MNKKITLSSERSGVYFVQQMIRKSVPMWTPDSFSGSEAWCE